MGVLDQLLTDLGGLHGQPPAPIASALSSLLDAPHPPGGELGLGETQGLGGGLPDLVTQFERAGLGDTIRSWIANGSNKSISGDQLQNVLGQARAHTLAEHAGMDQRDLMAQLAQHLPNVVDRMTPDGHLPGG